MKPTVRVLYRLFLFFAVPATLASLTANAAEPGAASAGNTNDLRAVTATSADIREGRRVAETTCGRCHGASGISAVKGVPHVAGQRPAYLYNKMRAYQTGARGDPAMEAAVKYLSDDALVNVAAYYASLDPPRPRASGKTPLPAPPDPVAAGKAAAASCGGCHGENGVSKTPGMPSLIGFDPKYFVVAVKSYADGHRKDDTMKAMAASLKDADLRNVALFYALQKPQRAQTPNPGDQAAGKKAAADCAGCHGEAGVSTNPANPSLAGQDAAYLLTALKAYKSGARTEGTMKNAVAALDERTMKDLAAFYAAQQPQAPKVVKPLSTAAWAQRCDRCHGVDGNSTDVRIPALAAQRADYLDKVLRDYRGGKRKDSVMDAMTNTLSDADIDGLAAYYSRKEARALVFVPAPCK